MAFMGYSTCRASINAFSFWHSPDVGIEDGTLYCSKWQVGSNCSTSDEAIQFRLRINQKGSWRAWDTTVNSNLGHGPTLGDPKTYPLYFEPIVTGTEDEVVVFSFDIMNFDPGDDANCWLFLDSLIVEEYP